MNIHINHPRLVLVEGEAVAMMKQIIRDKSIDLVCTDPPYGDHTHAMMGRDRRYDGRKTSEELGFPPLSQEQIVELAREFVRVAKGWIIIFTDDRTVDSWGYALEDAGARWIRTGYWVKTNPKPQMSADRPSAGVECIVIANVNHGKMEWWGGGRAAVWRGNRDPEGLHPNQKPAWLMQELLGLFGPAGGTVLDPFFGSGSTAVPMFVNERIPGLQMLDAGCKGCQKKHAEHMEGRPPLPFGMSIIGIEGHGPTLQVAKERLQPFLARYAA